VWRRSVSDTLACDMEGVKGIVVGGLGSCELFLYARSGHVRPSDVGFVVRDVSGLRTGS